MTEMQIEAFYTLCALLGFSTGIGFWSFLFYILFGRA